MNSSAGIVVDASVVADLLITPSSIPSVLGEVEVWHAPHLIEAEVLSVLRGHLLAGRLTMPGAQRAAADMGLLGLRLWPLEAAQRQLVLSVAHNLSAYDAMYVALAETLRVPLATRDQGLQRAAEGLVDIWQV